MCGICGWVSQGGKGPDSYHLEQMISTLSYRGPDEQTSVSFPSAGLAIARLAINDLKGGHQPYLNEDKSLWAVFNGEIYNFIELRSWLQKRGHRLRSLADGEVIVHLFEEFGPGFVEKLNGMFSIALWDGHKLYLFRDRLGIKPLYYGLSGGVLYFASELKALLELGVFSRRLNYGALRSYLSLEYVPAPLSIFKDIVKLAPACYLETGVEGSKVVRYWKFPELRPAGGSLEEWAERLGELLLDSVHKRMVADVPLGVFLSGGLDSSTIAALMCRLSSSKVHSFSVGFGQPSFDESYYSKLVARKLDTSHRHLTLGVEDTLGALEVLGRQVDEPLADAALIPVFLLARLARQEVTVVLSGEGADELLGGYPTYFAHQVAEAVKWLPGPVWGFVGSFLNLLPVSREYLSLDFKLKKFMSGMGGSFIERHFTWMGSFPYRGVSEVLTAEIDHAFNPASILLPQGIVERAQTLDFHSYLADDLLVKLDRATMLCSVEGRVPFLDHRLVEAMSCLPTSYKLRFLNCKRVLKEFSKDSLPAEILKRPKKGFGVPLADWLRGPMRPFMEHYLAESSLKEQGIFSAPRIRSLVEDHVLGRADNRKKLWTLICFQQWAERYRPVY